MGRPALDSEAVADVRERVCEVALRRFAEDGYRAVTLRGIAREMGRSHAMTYRYFDSKEAVFAAVRLRAIERFVEYQRARLAPIAEPAAAIREGARSYIDFAVAEPHVFRVLFDLDPAGAGDPALRDGHRRAFRLLEAVMRRAVAARVVAGEPAELAQLFWSGIHGIATLHLAGRLASRRTAQGLAVRLAETLLAGLRPDGATSS